MNREELLEYWKKQHETEHILTKDHHARYNRYNRDCPFCNHKVMEKIRRKL